MSANASTTIGRFQILNHNQLVAPGKCAGCGGFTNRHFIDFGLELDFYGVVYLCLETCFTEVANQIGFISPTQAAHLKLQLEVKEEEIEILSGKLNALEAVRDAIVDYSSVDPSVAVDSSGSSAVHSGSSDSGTKTEGSANPITAGGQPGNPGSEQGSTESSDVNGSSDVRPDDSLDEFAKQFDI